MKTGFRCGPCKTGVEPGLPLTFDPDCAECQRKKAAGKRTGEEPRPKRYAQRSYRMFGVFKRKAMS